MIRITTALFVATIFTVGCDSRPEGQSPPPVQPTRPTGEDGLRDGARLVLEEHCGSCHIGTYDTAIPGALAVYDLSQVDWASNLDLAQMKSIVSRLDDPLMPSLEDHDGVSSTVTPEQAATVERYLRELAQRRALDWDPLDEPSGG